jgi:hypothetical protein
MKLSINTPKVGRDCRARRGILKTILQKVAKGAKRLVSARTKFPSGAVFAFDKRKTSGSSFPWLSSVQIS